MQGFEWCVKISLLLRNMFIVLMRGERGSGMLLSGKGDERGVCERGGREREEGEGA